MKKHLTIPLTALMFLAALVSSASAFDGVLQNTWTKNIAPGAFDAMIGMQMAQNTSGWHAVSDTVNHPGPFEMYVAVVQLYSLSSGSTSALSPAIPTNLTATAVSSSRINLSWTASADNVSVTGYQVFRNGTQIATIATTSYSNTSLSPATSYAYTVTAYDVAGNVSSQSSAVSATTQTSGAPTTCTSLSIDCVVSQNSGHDTGIYPYGVRTFFSWYKGGSAAAGNSVPPSDFSSLAGWGQIYPQVGASNIAANIYLKDYRVYVHLTSGGWQLVQDQATNSVDGGHYVANFSNNSSSAMSLVVQSDGSVRMDSPASDYNDHFWIDPRGSYTPGTVNGVFTMAQLRTDSANANLIANFGGDWWRNASAPYLYENGVFVNNPGIGMGTWIKLTTTYQYFFFTTLTKSQLQAEPPPPLR